MKTNIQRKNLFQILILFLLIIWPLCFWAVGKYDKNRMQKRFLAVQKSITLPPDLKLNNSGINSFSQSGLPHYAPFATYNYTYSRSRQQDVHEAVLAELKGDGYTITANDASSKDHQFNYDWYVYGSNRINASEVHFEAQGNNISMKICRIHDCD